MTLSMKEVVFDHSDFIKKAPKEIGLNEKKVKSFIDKRLQAKHQMDTIAFEKSLSQLKKRNEKDKEKELDFELEFGNQSLAIQVMKDNIKELNNKMN